MVDTTVRQVISDALEDLSENDFDKFCHSLLNNSRVRRRAVLGKNYSQITDLLISKFTTAEAPKVALDILRLIECNDVAETLDSKTKALGDNGDPTFRKTSGGILDLNPSQEALKYVGSKRPLKTAQQGDPCNDKLMLSRSTIKFGKYKGQTFKWLLENDVGYTVFLVASHMKDREHSTYQSPLMTNKDSLTRYATAYPNVLKEVKFQQSYHSAKERSRKPGQEGKALVGFGKYRSKTLQYLYASKDKEIISYVNYLRNMTSTCDPGSRMEDAIKYILQRDQEKAGAPTVAKRRATSSAPPVAKRRATSSAPPVAKRRATSSAPPVAKRRATSSAPPAARKSQTRGKWVQSTRDQSTSASRAKKKMKH